MSTPETHVLIIGAGPTGMLLAQSLKVAGIKFSIFERDNNLFGRGTSANWGMGIYWSRPLLENLLTPEMFARITEGTADPTLDPSKEAFIPVLHGDTGELLHKIELSWVLRLSRLKVRTLFSEGVDVQYGKTLEKLEMSEDGNYVTAFFTDGSSATGTMVAGCDGGRSGVRRHALKNHAADSVDAPFVGVRSVFKLRTDEQALKARSIHPVAYMSIHPNGMWAFFMMLDVPDNAKPKDWTFQLITTWGRSSSIELDSTGRSPNITAAELKSHQDQFGGPFGEVAKWAHELPAEEIVHGQIRIGSWPTKHWNSFGGRLVLCGDAAHPMPFMRGQGLNNAINDVASFVDALKNIAKGGERLGEIEKCNAEVVERGCKAVEESTLNCEMVHDWSKFRQSDVILKGTMHV
jgi:2-polyprenyl-6-methoxyphenol hydroxylase-like FAD-dependent oxidoreductase